MCWTLEISVLFGAVGLLGAAFLAPRHPADALMAAYFASMEFIQAAQHLVLAADDDPLTTCARGDNRFWTAVGLAHVCFQPLVLHWSSVANGRLSKAVLRLVLVGCLLDAAAMTYANLSPPDYDWEACRGDQWVAGSVLCTTRGAAHLLWTTPLPRPSYEYHGGLHSFLFFAPFLCGNGALALRGLGLYLSGPVLARWWVGPGADEREAASTWCFLYLANMGCACLCSALSPSPASLSLLVKPKRP